MIDLPDVRQKKDFDCGDAAVTSVLRYFGLKATHDLSNPIDGTDPATAEALLRAAGLNVCAGTMTARDLKHFTDRGAPVLCPVTFPDGGHWVVVRGVARLVVYFQDPLCGPTSLPASRFAAVWVGGTRAGRAFDKWGICAWK